MSIEPIGDRVVVKRDKESDRTPGGVVLPDAARPHKRIGTIIAIGPGAMRFNQGFDEQDHILDRLPMQCKVGDRVLMPHHAEVILLDEADPDSEVVVCPENQLLAILT